VRRQLFTLALIAIVVLGLALRVWSAQGGLWVDEAWSAVLLERTGTPAGIFWAINHDNNHHLNSLWMQFCGSGASPLKLRALSIATGTLTILVAAAIGARQSLVHALVAALLFAVSPILVNYGSEARGYAPMLLAAMTMVWRIQSRLMDPADGGRRPAWGLAGLALVGLFSQLTMLFFIMAIAVWVAWSLGRRMSVDTAIRRTFRLLLPTFGATLLAFGTVWGAAALSPNGMEVGGYVPFSLADWFGALSKVTTTTLGLSVAGPWLAATLILTAAITTFVFRAGRQPAPTGPFLFIAIFLFPLMFPLLQIGNSSMPRYYLLASIATLLLMVDVFAVALAGRRTRVAAAVILAALATACLQENFAQAAFKRGDSGAAIEAMKRRSPAGATIMVDQLRPSAVLRVAAASAAYPLAVLGDCPARRFLYVELDPLASVPLTTIRCGKRYTLVMVRQAARLSGSDWALYDDADPLAQTVVPAGHHPPVL
jgi:hypothetical protein